MTASALASNVLLLICVLCIVISPFNLGIEAGGWLIIAFVTGVSGWFLRLFGRRPEPVVETAPQETIRLYGRDELRALRDEKDRYFRNSAGSPLTAEQRQTFTGLNYFPLNPDAAFTVKLEEFPDKMSVPIATSRGPAYDYLRWGEVRFRYDGAPCRLTVYRADPDDENLFVPFADATSGQSTYGAGRYLELIDEGNGYYLLDFNRAYNPFCAYNDEWVCPMPPPENRLNVAIEAGEKTFRSH